MPRYRTFNDLPAETKVRVAQEMGKALEGLTAEEAATACLSFVTGILNLSGGNAEKFRFEAVDLFVECRKRVKLPMQPVPS